MVETLFIGNATLLLHSLEQWQEAEIGASNVEHRDVATAVEFSKASGGQQ
jgi:hypothetical protein